MTTCPAPTRRAPIRQARSFHFPARLLVALLLSLGLLLAGLLGSAPAGAAENDPGVVDTLHDPMTPPIAGGLERIDRLLAKLTTHRRLMVIGAHPDDEDNSVLALVARGMGGEAAYLSLSRGDGGQNLIGPELGVGLGLLRSRELEAARRIDGARQYFTRAYDFGYTRSLTETFERWPRQVLLEDAVRAIRRFKPQVIVAVFPPDERAGHGQHQASAVIAGEGYAAAGDDDAFPALAAEGLAPWRPEAFYRAAWWRPEGATFRYPLGGIEPVSGRSIFQIAMASRSQHRCQDMGMLQPLGPFDSGVVWEAGGAGPEGEDLFAGVETSLAGIAAVLGREAEREEIATELAEVESLARQARRELSPSEPRSVLPAALEIYRGLWRVRGRFPKHSMPGGDPSEQAFLELLGEKHAVARDLVLAAAGVAIDAYADREVLAPGADFTVELAVWDSAGVGVEVVDAQPISTVIGVEPVEPDAQDGPASRFFGAGDRPEEGFHLRTFNAHVPADAQPTVPYFLERPLDGDLYDWSETPAEIRGEPFGAPPLSAFFRLRIAGETVTLWREVVLRQRDQARGEVRRPLRVVPEVEIAAAQDVVVWPIEASGARPLEVVLTSHAGGAISGRVEAEMPPGWPAVAPVPFDLDAGARQAIELELTPPEPYLAGAYPVRLSAVIESDGGAEAGAEGGEGQDRRYRLAVPLVDYPHIVPVPRPVAAEVRISATDLALPRLGRVGYVRGASDRVPEALTEVGVPVEILDPEHLEAVDLSAYDAIVIGSRAYETQPALADANPRLLAYARGGGLVIVQYQQYQYIAGGFAPYRLEIARPHGRVTDETAPVTLLEPAYPAFTRPNRLTAADWDGWVQERGLYMPAAWDEPFVPLLETADPGGEPQRGGLLVAPIGTGTYVYTGLAFFRQLPAGVPGAFRLFANLLALGRDGGESEGQRDGSRPVGDPR